MFLIYFILELPPLFQFFFASVGNLLVPVIVASARGAILAVTEECMVLRTLAIETVILS